MKPGRELDAQVAQAVMGWTHREPVPCDGMLGELPGGGCTCECGWVGNWGDGHMDTRASEPPYYSTDIAAAWEVVRHVYGAWDISSHGSMWRVRLATPQGPMGDKFMTIDSDTVEHAICLAALESVAI